MLRFRTRAQALATMAVLASSIVVGGTASLAASPPPTTLGAVDVDTATIPELQAAMDAGDLTSVQLVQFYLDRIEAIEPDVNAIIALSSTALADAQKADEARASGTDSPLLGIPVLLKDNIGTTGMPTTAGSYALETSEPPDAFIVQKLRDAGAIILGKANLSEWANMRSYPSSSGWSAIGGQTNNPYALDRNPCGSSAGSAAAVAASMVSVAVGTETDGSITCPASATGIVGVKPTIGLVSRTGIVPISSQQDTAGPMARNVTDAAVLLGVLAGADPADPATAGAAAHSDVDYVGGLDADALKGARIGVWRAGNFGLLPSVDAIMEDAIARMEAAGATIVDPADLVLDGMGDAEFPALLCEFKHDIATYLATLGPDAPKTLQDLIDFNLEHAAVEMAAFKQETFDEAQAAAAIDDPTCVEARATATRIGRAAIDDALAANDLDAIIAPAGEPAPLTDPVGGDVFVGPYSAPPAAVSGYASVTVPAGYVSGLPVGLSLIGGAFSEPELLALAYAFEQAADVRVAPTLPESVEPPPAPPPLPSEGPAASGAPAGSDEPAGSAAPS